MIKFYIESLVKFTEKQLGNIIYIGAGSGGQVGALCELTPTSLVAVESSQQLVGALERKLKKYKFATVLNSWVFPGANTEGRVCLYNNPRFNSLKPSAEFVRGNIKLEKEEAVVGVSLERVLVEEGLPEDLLNVLVLDVLAADGFLAELTKNTDIVSKLNFVIVPKESLSRNKEQISFFDCHEYTLIPTFDDSKLYIFQNNLSFLTCNKTQELERISTELEKGKEKISKVIEDAENEKASYQAQIEKAKQELEAKTVSAKKREEESREKLASTANSRDELKKELESLKSTLQQKEQDVRKLSEQIEHINKQNELHHAELTKKAEESKARELQSNSTADLTCKLNLKLQADLDHLRQKYSEKVEAEAELTNLVDELYVKLKQAAEFYHALEIEHPEIASGQHEQ